MLMGVLRDTILVSVATLGVGSAFMEIDSKNATFNKVFPYIGTFLSAGIGYYFLRQSKLIKAGEFQPDQELSDYSLNDLATSSAIEGFEPLKYSVVGNRAEGLETKKEEPLEYEDPLESWMEEYDAESVLKEKPSMNFTWKKFSDWEIEPTMQKIKDMTENEMIVPYPFGKTKSGTLRTQEFVDDPNVMIYPYKQNLKQYMELVSLSGYLKYGDATFYLLQTNMNVLKDKVKRGDSEYKVENSYLVYCEHDGKMNLVCGASYPIKDDKVYRLLSQTVPTIRQGFVVGRKEATQYAEDYLYFHLLKPELEYSFDESFEIEFGERKQEDYQNMIIPLKYKRKIKGKAVPFTNYYYTNHRGELDFLFAIGELDRPLNEKLTFYCDMGWQFGTYNTTDSNYPMPKLSWSKNYGVERLVKIFAERPIIQMWVKSITLDSDNLKTRRINMFNDDKQAWFDQQFKPMLVANYSPLILTGLKYPSVNVYEEFMKMTHKRLEANNAYPAKKDLGFPVELDPLPYFKQDISYYDFISSVYRSSDRENPLLYQKPGNPLTPLYNRFVNKRNPYGFSDIRTYYTIQGKMTFNLDKVKENLNLLSVPQPPVGWYKRMRTESLMEQTEFGRIASGILTIGVYLNNSIYQPPISIIPFEINDTKNQYVKAFRLLYSRALRENQIADPQTIFEDRLKWSLYSLDEDAIMELDRSNDEAKKVVEDYYKQLDDMVLEELGGYGFKHHSVRKAENFESESTSKIHSVEISRSSNPEKKLMAIFSDKEGNKVKTTHFGQRGASDYTKHGDKERMLRYLERHGGGTTTSTKEDWKDPTTAGSLSRWVLWNKPSLSGSFADYKRRFGLKGSLNVSKSSEGLETKNAEYYSPPENYDFKPNFEEMNERFDEILESAKKLSKPKLKRVLGLANDNPLTRRPMIKAASISYFMKEAKDQFPKEMYIEYYMRNFTKQELCHLNLITRIQGWNLTELRKLTKRELSDMLIIEEMGIAFKSETFEATEWVGFCPECNKWRTKDMSLLFKNNTNRSDEDYIIDLSFNGWSVPKKLLNKRVCGKSKQYGDIQRTTDSWSGYGQRTYSNSVCGTPLTKVKSKYKAEFEAKSPAQKSLDKWTKEDWGTKSGKPSTQGEEATGERYLPAKAREALTDKEYARTTAKKRRDTKAGKQFSPQPDDIEEKVKKYRSDMNNQTMYDYYGPQDPLSTKGEPPMIVINSKYDHDGDYRVDEIIYDDMGVFLGLYAIWFKYSIAKSWKGLEGFDIKLIPLTENNYSIVILMKGKSLYQNKLWKIVTDYEKLRQGTIYDYETIPYREIWQSASTGYDYEADAYYVKLHQIYLDPTWGGKYYKPIWDIYNDSMNAETFEAIEGKGSNARFTDQPDPKVYRDPALRQKARNKLLKGDKGGEEGEWSARKAQMSATEYRKLYENKYGEGKNPYF